MMQMMMGGALGISTLFTGSMRSDPFTSGPLSGSGYSTLYGNGTLSPSTFTALGRTLTVIAALDTISPGPNYQSFISISGFDPLVNPGHTFLYSAQWVTEFIYTQGLGGYGFASGTATWTFSTTATPSFGFNAYGTNNLILRG